MQLRHRRATPGLEFRLRHLLLRRLLVPAGRLPRLPTHPYLIRGHREPPEAVGPLGLLAGLVQGTVP